jgi:hypothetical protein
MAWGFIKSMPIATQANVSVFDFTGIAIRSHWVPTGMDWQANWLGTSMPGW